MKKVRPLFSLLFRVLAAVCLFCFPPRGLGAAVTAEELLNRIHKNRLDASAIYKVRELALSKEDARFYFTEGILALLEPIRVDGEGDNKPGRITGALFVGEGEMLLVPPDAMEKRNLARFTGAPVLDEKFSSAYMSFTDDTAARLMEGLRTQAGGSDQPAGNPCRDCAEFMQQWGPAVQNLTLLNDLRILGDLLSRPAGPAGSPNLSFFSAHLFGQRLGAFDLTVDFRAREQVMVGQFNWKEGRRYMDLWCSFPARSARSSGIQRERSSLAGGGLVAVDEVSAASYRIEAVIHPDRQLEVTAELDLAARVSGDRLLTFELSRFLKVTGVESAGRPLTYYQNET